MLASWGRKAAVVGLLVYGLGLLWLGNRSVDVAVAVCLVVVGALLALAGIGTQPRPFPLRGDIPRAVVPGGRASAPGCTPAVCCSRRWPW